MRRTLLLLAFLPLLVGCGNVITSLPPAHAASPQRAELGWLESIGDKSGRIDFGVRSFEVTDVGWRADISVENDTELPFAVGLPGRSDSLTFGLMLFSTGAHSELETRNANNSLPAIRPAETYTPALPKQLGAHETWTGTIAGGGPVAAGTWARIVYGALFSVPAKDGTSAPQLPDALRKANIDKGLVWITDHAYELRR